MADNEKEEAILKAIREAMDEMTQAQQAAQGLLEGFSFLWEKTGKKFTFDEKPTTDGSLVLETSLHVTGHPAYEPLRFTVSTKGAITDNRNTGLQAPPQRGLNEIEDADIQSASPPPPRAVETAEALAEIGRELALLGYVASADIAESEADSAIIKAALAGIRRAEEEMATAEQAADDFAAGLSVLKEQSQGKLDFIKRKVRGGCDTELQVFSPDYTHFPAIYIKFGPNGEITTSRNSSYINGQKYDVLEKPEAADAILTEIARAAFFGGQVPPVSNEAEAGDFLLAAALTTEAQDTNGNGAAGIVRAAFREAAGEKAMARAAARELADGLASLHRQSRGKLVIGDVKQSSSSNVVLNVKLKDPASLDIVIDAKGKMKVGKDAKEYNAWQDADVAAVLSDIARKAVFQGYIRPKAKRPQGPAQEY